MIRWDAALGLALVAASCSSSRSSDDDDDDNGDAGRGTSSGSAGASAAQGGGARGGGASSGATAGATSAGSGATSGSTSNGGDGASGGSSNVGGTGDPSGGGESGSSPDAAGAAGDSGSGGTLVEPPPELTWTKIYSVQGLQAIWGSGPNDVYFVGGSGTIYHFDGENWQNQISPTGANLMAVWGSGPNDVYIAPYINAMLHSTGDGKWTSQTLTPGWTFVSVWGLSETEVLAVNGAFIRLVDGKWSTMYERVDSTYGVVRVCGTSLDDLWFINHYGTIHHYRGPDDNRYQYFKDTLEENAALEMQDLDMAGADDIYISGRETILHSKGDGVWENQYPWQDEHRDLLYDIDVVDKTAIFAATQAGYVLRSGGDGRWFRQLVDPSVDSASKVVWAIWAASRNDVFAATGHGIFRGTAP